MAAYGVFSGNIPFVLGDFFLESAQDNITANAGGGQASAFQLNSQTARVATVATAGDSVKLPASAPGLEMLVINHGANSMQVFGLGSDTIDDQASATGVAHMANSLVIYTCTTAGKWYTEGLSTGFSTSLGLQTLKPSAIAASGTDTAIGGTPVTALITTVTTSASSQAVTLPPALPGLAITIHSVTATNTLDVFPGVAGTDAINALGAGTKITMAALSSATFTCVTAGTWFTVPRVPS